jgi:putative transposase
VANTYYSLTIHCVFSTRNREPSITGELRDRLWPFMGGILRQNKIKALSIGGTANHVHVLISLPTTLSVAKAVQLLKGSSSKWIHETFPKQQTFGWQRGYGAFSVGISHIDETVAYIRNQVEHHRTKSFEEEYLIFLRKHQIDYDERYLWH